MRKICRISRRTDSQPLVGFLLVGSGVNRFYDEFRMSFTKFLVPLCSIENRKITFASVKNVEQSLFYSNQFYLQMDLKENYWLILVIIIINHFINQPFISGSGTTVSGVEFDPKKSSIKSLLDLQSFATGFDTLAFTDPKGSKSSGSFEGSVLVKSF